jgi:hypothetical protein
MGCRGRGECGFGAGAPDGVESTTLTGAVCVNMRDGNDIRCRTWLSCIASVLLVHDATAWVERQRLRVNPTLVICAST